MKVLETRIVPLASALTLNPSPKKGEGLQSGTPLLPFWEKGLGDVELALPEGWASHLRSVRTIAKEQGAVGFVIDGKQGASEY